jgi:hypothetical protein
MTPEFVPSWLLVAEIRRARRLRRNLEHASIFNARLVRRALEARDRARALHAHELRAFKEAA